MRNYYSAAVINILIQTGEDIPRLITGLGYYLENNNQYLHSYLSFHYLISIIIFPFPKSMRVAPELLQSKRKPRAVSSFLKKTY